MQTHEEHILLILAEAIEPLYPSDITDRANQGLGTGDKFTTTEIVLALRSLKEQVEQTTDGRWTLKRRVSR